MRQIKKMGLTFSYFRNLFWDRTAEVFSYGREVDELGLGDSSRASRRRQLARASSLNREGNNKFLALLQNLDIEACSNIDSESELDYCDSDSSFSQYSDPEPIEDFNFFV